MSNRKSKAPIADEGNIAKRVNNDHNQLQSDNEVYHAITGIG